MTFLDVFSLFVLLVIIVGVVALILVLAWLPGHIAKGRRSPWVDAINVGGWIGILFPPFWMLALVAAFYRPRVGEGAAIAISEKETAQLVGKLTALTARIDGLESGLRDLVPKATSRGAGG